MTLNIICQVERLGPQYDNGWVHFSINVSATFSDGPVTREVVNNFLKMWEWKWDTVRLRGIDEKNERSVFIGDAGEVTSTPPTNIQMVKWGIDDTSAFNTVLEQKFNSYLDNGGTFNSDIFSIATTKQGEINFSEEEVTGETDAPLPSIKWHSVISQEWNRPQPIPIKLNLCAFFRIRQEQLQTLIASDVTALVAAPVYSGGALGHAAPVSGATNMPLTDTAGLFKENLPGGVLHLVWNYATDVADTPLPFNIVARINNCSILDTDLDVDKSIIDLRSLFVKSSNMGENWLPTLTEIVTDAFDLPALLLQAIRKLKNNDAGRPALVKAYLSSLHDLVHQGTFTAPNKQRLIDYVLWKFNTPDGPNAPKDLTESFKTALDSVRFTYTTWIDFLKQSLLIDAIISNPENAPIEFLDTLYTSITDPVQVSSLVLRQWDNAISATGVDEHLKVFWQNNKEKITADFSNIDLRRLLAHGIAGLPWKNIPRLGDTTTIDEPDEIKSFLVTELKNHLQKRFDSHPSNDEYDYFSPREGAIAADIIVNIDFDAIADKVIRKYMTVEGSNASSSFSVKPETLSFKVDRVQQDAATTSEADQSDLIRKISGSVVLLRKKGGTWRCLNYVTIKDLTRLLVAPLPYGYINELRQSIIEYNNQPLVAGFSNLSQNGTFNPSGQGRQTVVDSTVVEYGNPYINPAQHPDARLVSLQYGQEYEALFCAASTASALPKEVAAIDATTNNAIPWKLTSTITSDVTRHIHTKHFKRAVKVGGLSFKQDDNELKKLVLPQNVTPLAKSLLPVTGELSKEGVEAEPLILLAGQKDTTAWAGSFKDRQHYRFTIFPPNTSDKVWERWTAGDTTNWPAALRKKVLAAWNRVHDTDPDNTSATTTIANEVKHTIDDPAVTHLRIELTQLWPKPALNKAPFQIPFPALNKDLASLECVQSKGLEINIETNKDIQQINIAGAADKVTIQIPEEEIWRISFFPIVAGSNDRARFESGMLDDNGKPLAMITEAGEKIYDRGYNIIVEIATPFPANNKFATRLHDGLRLGTGDVIQRTTNDIQLFLHPDADKTFWPWIHRAEILLQRWRWNGRPLVQNTGAGNQTGFPFSELIGASSDSIADRENRLKGYEDVLFATRENDDHLATSVSANLIDINGNITAGTQIYKHVLGANRGALYFRVGVKVYNRYEGVLSKGHAIDSRLQIIDTQQTLNNWKRLLVLCRYNGEVPPPVIRFAIPLTRAIDSRSPMPGVLIVMDEPGYSDHKYGFAEIIEADIERATTPQKELSVLEMGPDPILRNVIDINEEQVELIKEDTQTTLAGPTGYTFDTNSDAPLFTRASYVWTLPPELREATENGIHKDYSFYFLKTKFRRKIDIHGHALGSEKKYLPDAFVSAWTQARWLRILPPANFIRIKTQLNPQAPVSWVKVDDLTLTTIQEDASKTIKFRLPKEEGRIFVNPEDLLTTTVDEQSRLKLVFYVLLTKVIPDALGKQDSEAYLKLIPVQLITQQIDVVKSATFARLVEIAYDKKSPFTATKPFFDPATANEEDIFNALIPATSDSETTTGNSTNNKAAIAMITRVSAPFSVQID